jgi:hypothetical protein
MYLIKAKLSIKPVWKKIFSIRETFFGTEKFVCGGEIDSSAPVNP